MSLFADTGSCFYWIAYNLKAPWLFMQVSCGRFFKRKLLAEDPAWYNFYAHGLYTASHYLDGWQEDKPQICYSSWAFLLISGSGFLVTLTTFLAEKRKTFELEVCGFLKQHSISVSANSERWKTMVTCFIHHTARMVLLTNAIGNHDLSPIHADLFMQVNMFVQSSGPALQVVS